MKSLKEFLIESKDEKCPKTKSFEFSFAELTDGENTLKSLQEIADKHGIDISVNGDKMTVKNVDADSSDALEPLTDVLQQYAEKLRSEQKNSSDEQYASKTKKFANMVGELNDFLNGCDEEE